MSALSITSCDQIVRSDLEYSIEQCSGELRLCRDLRDAVARHKYELSCILNRTCTIYVTALAQIQFNIRTRSVFVNTYAWIAQAAHMVAHMMVKVQ